MFFHAVLSLAGGGTRYVSNKSEAEMLTDVVIPFVNNGTVPLKRGGQKRLIQIYGVMIYGTETVWSRKSGTPLEKHIARRKNRFDQFSKKAKSVLNLRSFRAFIIMPIQGDEYGNVQQQMIKREFDSRFEEISKLLDGYNCAAIRIDKEMHLGNLVDKIKKEIHRADFVIADLTEERPSCYFEAGYANALEKPIIYIAGKQSIIDPTRETNIHFDIHENMFYFANQIQLIDLLSGVIKARQGELMPPEG